MDKIWIILAVVLAFAITSISGMWLLPILRKLHFGQTILDIGPRWHKNKQGTPTMGGIMFIFGIVLSVVASFLLMQMGGGLPDRPDGAAIKARLFYGLMLAIAFGLIGFVDDYLKVVRKQNEGLTPNQKLFLQLLFGASYLGLLYISGSRSTALVVPFLGILEIGPFYYPFALFAILALSNAVNFTDGLDGLLSSVTFVVAIAYMILTVLLGQWELEILAGAMAGGCLGFLIGSMSAFVSNFLFGQGPWTPYQMIASAIIGYFAGFLFYNRHVCVWIVALFGGIATFFIYGGIVDLWTIFYMNSEPTLASAIVVYSAAIYFNTVHAMATVLFLSLFTKPMMQKINRIKNKYDF